MNFTTICLYNHFLKPLDKFTYENYKIYDDLFYQDGIDIKPNGQIAMMILSDFFGIDSTKQFIIEEQQKINILYGIYYGLLKIKYCDMQILDKCFKFNRLDELILEKFKYNKSGYYTKLIKEKIKIGKTYNIGMFNDNNDFIDDEKNIIYKNFKIFNDDHCPCCNNSGYITEKKNLEYHNGIVPDCKKCFIPMCIYCSFIDKEEPWTRFCIYCFENKSTNNLNKNIIHKINNHKAYDKRRFNAENNINLDNIMELIRKQNNKCYICDEDVILINWKPYCCYQFSIDRINDNEPHNINNVLISCYYCNCRHYPKFDQHNKVCRSKCHKEEKKIINKNEINKKYIF